MRKQDKGSESARKVSIEKALGPLDEFNKNRVAERGTPFHQSRPLPLILLHMGNNHTRFGAFWWRSQRVRRLSVRNEQQLQINGAGWNKSTKSKEVKAERDHLTANINTYARTLKQVKKGRKNKTLWSWKCTPSARNEKAERRKVATMSRRLRSSRKRPMWP